MRIGVFMMTFDSNEAQCDEFKLCTQNSAMQPSLSHHILPLRCGAIKYAGMPFNILCYDMISLMPSVLTPVKDFQQYNEHYFNILDTNCSTRKCLVGNVQCLVGDVHCSLGHTGVQVCPNYYKEEKCECIGSIAKMFNTGFFWDLHV